MREQLPQPQHQLRPVPLPLPQSIANCIISRRHKKSAAAAASHLLWLHCLLPLASCGNCNHSLGPFNLMSAF